MQALVEIEFPGGVRMSVPAHECAALEAVGRVPHRREPVEGNRFDVRIAAQVIVMNYQLCLFLYRVLDLFVARGWTPSRSTLVKVLAVSRDLVLAFVELYRREALANELLGCDDTNVTLITPPLDLAQLLGGREWISGMALV